MCVWRGSTSASAAVEKRAIGADNAVSPACPACNTSGSAHPNNTPEAKLAHGLRSSQDQIAAPNVAGMRLKQRSANTANLPCNELISICTKLGFSVAPAARLRFIQAEVERHERYRLSLLLQHLVVQQQLLENEPLIQLSPLFFQ